MKKCSYRAAAAALVVLSGVSTAYAQSNNPVCQRLEMQLGTLDRGNADPAKADQIRRTEDMVNRQQFEVDRLVSQSRHMGCEVSGFFSIFSNPPPQCGPLRRQIDQQRLALERIRNQLEQLNGGTTERAAQRQSLLIALADNSCGPQYRSAALAGQQGGFFDRLFGGNNSGFYSTPPGPMGGTFRTICVRTCDGYYFPISYSTSPEHFREDEQSCQRLCPAAEVALYTYHNPGEEVAQAVSLNGRPYTELPAAFQYRKALNPSCSCRRPGESWADALKATGPDDTVVPGDVVVTEQNSKQLSQPRKGSDAKPTRDDRSSASQQSAPSSNSETPAESPSKRKVRTVGPTFLPSN
ncbi:MAG TPA: DUF2865 domain-containing protein [Pseudolabrys sp.]|nr:DUF2865 domain-containing protein [Pseudolabrys sp.]